MKQHTELMGSWLFFKIMPTRHVSSKKFIVIKKQFGKACYSTMCVGLMLVMLFFVKLSYIINDILLPARVTKIIKGTIS